MINESYQLIGNTGEILYFSFGELYLLNNTGYGNPDLQYNEVQNFLQDGVSVESFQSVPREITIRIVKNTAKDRVGYWKNREELLRFFNPYMAPLTFRVTRSDGSIRELRDIYPQNGIIFDNTSFTEWTIDETVTLTAKNPIWVDPNEIVLSGFNADTELIFPVQFPISFSSGSLVYSPEINYTGQWKSYPKITIHGPFTRATLSNNCSCVQISLVSPVGINDYREIDLEPSTLSIKDSQGKNKISEVSEDSNFVDFYLKPFFSANKPIRVELTETDENYSLVSIAYTNKYLGI